MKRTPFYQQAELLLRCLPAIESEPCFAMKGGTAINMFVRPMPRLSVDIDLTYVPIEDRQTSLHNISAAIGRIAIKIQKTVLGAKVLRTDREDRIIKLVVHLSGVTVKIEPNEVLRGTISKPVVMPLVKEAEDLFELSANASIVPMADLYGGKICAALDRQHPRDLFDVKILLEQEGLTDAIRKGFLIFLCSHDRPMHELLRPNLKNLTTVYNSEFKGMTIKEVTLDDLINARADLIETLQAEITTDERKFLLSLKSGQPKWDLLGTPGVELLPGIQWKLQNIQRMNPVKRTEQLAKLEAVLKI